MPRVGSGAFLLVLLAGAATAGESAVPDYFPLRIGNWWSYEELGEDGKALSRETWTLVPDAAAPAGEFHLRSLAKRFDGLQRVGRRWEGHEYLREATEGLHKRYPAGRDAELDVVLLKAPASSGTRWRDGQGACEVANRGDACAGPRGELPDCLAVVCRLGTPPATIVTSIYARGVGMVEQKIEVIELLPAMPAGAGGGMLPSDGTAGAHSTLRLTGYHVEPTIQR